MRAPPWLLPLISASVRARGKRSKLGLQQEPNQLRSFSPPVSSNRRPLNTRCTRPASHWTDAAPATNGSPRPKPRQRQARSSSTRSLPRPTQRETLALQTRTDGAAAAPGDPARGGRALRRRRRGASAL
eukprot:scaffold7983_cov390-Prasinococcus_capsulatus_cf.AAC.1